MEIRTTKYDEVEKELGEVKPDLLDKSATYQVAYFKDKLVWVEDYLNIDNKRKYDNSGITEIRLLTFEEVKQTIESLKSQLTEQELKMKALKRKQLLEETA